MMTFEFPFPKPANPDGVAGMASPFTESSTVSVASRSIEEFRSTNRQPSSHDNSVSGLCGIGPMPRQRLAELNPGQPARTWL